MRRPLCLFCAGALGVELVCAFLPQAWLLPLLAAIFVCGLLAAVLGRKPLKLGGILLLAGAVLGLGAVLRTHARLNALQTAYDGTSVTLTAEVEQVRTSFYPGVVDAVLRVETVDGEAADFRVECAALPRCSAGERVRGTFALEALPEGEQRSAYADGIALNAELAGGTKLERLGESRSFRARTARLQSRLSAALRRGMAEDPAGVLAAMVTGDRSHLSTRLRNAYRGAGLSHVLVVSGMHVSILCGSVLARFRLKRRKLRSYASCRRNALLRAGMAVLLVGVTSFTPSVLRAGAAVWISALGVWVYGPADALTSLGVAGVLMTAGNSYAVCDIGFELSFAAVLGTLAGAALARRSAERWEEKRRRNKKTAGKRGGVLANCLRQQGQRCGRRSASPAVPVWRPFRCWCCGA
ncbi:ComEC/Rec2 family competence protein [Faecalibacterium prausnitzii]|uniref:ComEC/Rec2 family competence protein n=1 Tax=Faecalibacterium prausnitzii TaxID=853 RepID=UPI003C2F170E